MSERSKIRARITKDKTLTEAIKNQIVENKHIGEGSLMTVPLEKIARNPSNPRTLPITIKELMDIRDSAISGTTDLSDEGGADEVLSAIGRIIGEMDDSANKAQIEGIFLLAKSIHANGLMQPISLYRGHQGRLVIQAGERRHLAHVLLGRETVRAIVKESAGDEIQTRIGSLIENINREDLSTAEKIDYIEDLVQMYEKKNGVEVTQEILHEMIHESKRTCFRYLRYIKAPVAIRQAIRSGELNSIREIEDKLSEHTGSTGAEKSQEESTKSGGEGVVSPRPAKTGRQRKFISLGRTNDTAVIQTLIRGFIGDDQLKKDFSDVDWHDMDSAQAAWNLFLQQVSKDDGGEHA